MTVANPVVYFAFNRPERTRRTFERIRAARPRRLLLVADGPRPSHPEDQERCAGVREVLSAIDWPCSVERDFADTNLGLRARLSSGLDWAFSIEDRAIVLEDDCLAGPDFFAFCDALLERYADDPRVAAITGDNFQVGRRADQPSYYFSKYSHCWGWASWARAWANYDVDLSFWPEWHESDDFMRAIPDRNERAYWTDIFERTWRGEINTWDYQWTAANMRSGGLTATPRLNLVANIGFGEGATHTLRGAPPPIADEPLGELVHPEDVAADVEADRVTFDGHYGGRRRRKLGPAFGLARWARSLVRD